MSSARVKRDVTFLCKTNKVKEKQMIQGWWHVRLCFFHESEGKKAISLGPVGQGELLGGGGQLQWGFEGCIGFEEMEGRGRQSLKVSSIT